MRLALYAHYSESGGLARYVLFYLRKLRELGFQICFISNSPIPKSGEQELHDLCEKIIQRENTGYDFAMWRRALAEYELTQFEELLLTNSSIVGPFNPLEPLWQRAAVNQCDFWGLTDNDDLGRHLQSYFLLFRRQVLEHPCFQTFWHSVLPFRDKQLVIGSYEIGLTRWLEQHGFNWNALFPQKDIHALFLNRLSFTEKLKNRFRPVWLPQNTTVLLPDLLLECGMPFLKIGLLKGDGEMLFPANRALRLLDASSIPSAVLDELRIIAS
ncbi:MAG: rhamnan synthesis F family protein [Terracidiphilus sp.]